MTDKVQKIRKEVARIQLYTQSEVLKQILDYIDSLQEEPVSEQNLSNVERTGKNWKEEPIIEVLNRYLDRVPDEEVLKTKMAINEWFSEYFPKLQEETELSHSEVTKISDQEEPVSIDFEQELYKAFGQVKDFTLGMQIAKWFFKSGAKWQAEKDLELTWEDIWKIDDMVTSMSRKFEWQLMSVEQFYKEALKRFKESRK